MKKTILVTEEAHNRVMQRLLAESYSDKVLMIKDFLDNNFVRANFSKEDENGVLTALPIVVQLDVNKQPSKKTLDDVSLFYLLQNKFQKILALDTERDKLLKQVIKDWYKNAITPNGSLTKY